VNIKCNENGELVNYKILPQTSQAISVDIILSIISHFANRYQINQWVKLKFPSYFFRYELLTNKPAKFGRTCFPFHTSILFLLLMGMQKANDLPIVSQEVVAIPLHSLPRVSNYIEFKYFFFLGLPHGNV
jgi:hypothetical protein